MERVGVMVRKPAILAEISAQGNGKATWNEDETP